MISKVITVTSGKGGVGKTTPTANLGTALAKDGMKTLVIDTDIGLRNLDVVMGLENRVVYDVVDIIEGRCKPKQAMIKSRTLDNLFLIPAAQTRDKDSITPEQMKQLVLELKKDFDFILIDCPAGIESGFKNAIAGADEAIIVTTPEVSAVRDADRIVGLLAANEMYEPKLILNRVRMDMMQRGDMMSIEDVLDILNIDLLGVVPDDESIIISTNKGESVLDMSKSTASQAYFNIAKRMQGEDIPFMNLNPEKSFLSKFKKVIGL